MDNELQKLLDAVMEPVQRFHSARKRIVGTVLTEENEDLLGDPFANSGLEGMYRELQRREVYRRAQTQWLTRNLLDLLSRPESEEGSWLWKSETHGAQAKADSVTGQLQPTHQNELL